MGAAGTAVIVVDSVAVALLADAVQSGRLRRAVMCRRRLAALARSRQAATEARLAELRRPMLEAEAAKWDAAALREIGVSPVSADVYRRQRDAVLAELAALRPGMRGRCRALGSHD